MNNKIVSITQLFEFKIKYDDINIYDGFKVYLDNHDTYLVLIESGQQCCEDYGAITTNDNIDEFIGSNLLDVKLTNKLLKTSKLSEKFKYISDDEIQFVDFETDKGILQLVIYNSHNGYYGHNISFKKNGVDLLNKVI